MQQYTKNSGNELKKSLKTKSLLFLAAKNELETNSNLGPLTAVCGPQATFLSSLIGLPASVAGHHLIHKRGANRGGAEIHKNGGNEQKKSLKTKSLLLLDVKNELKTNSVSRAFAAFLRENTATFRTNQARPLRHSELVNEFTVRARHGVPVQELPAGHATRDGVRAGLFTPSQALEGQQSLAV